MVAATIPQMRQDRRERCEAHTRNDSEQLERDEQ